MSQPASPPSTATASATLLTRLGLETRATAEVQDSRRPAA